MNTSQHCLSSDDIRVFLDGASSQLEDTVVVRHLDHCPACRAALEENAGGSLWLEHVQNLLSDADCIGTSEARSENSVATIDAYLVANRLTFLAPTDDPRMIGRMGVYEVSGVIGYGGMGVILKALEPSLNRYVALKVLWPHLAVHGAARQRFAREARAAAAVVHEHVVPIYAVDEFQGIPYIVMQYVPGRSLQDRITRDGGLPLEQILRIGRQIAAALDAAHAQGLVHRDVKPANILLENGIERVLVTDFGLARTADDASLTHSGMVAGTPQFMSPEQARGELIDHRSDLFSLGSVLYTMCTGHPPFRAETLMGSLTRICNDAARPLREINAGVPAWLEAFVSKLMAKDADRRFQSAADVARILEKELAHLQNPVSVSRPDRRWETRRLSLKTWKVSSIATVVLLCGLLLAGRSWWFPTSPVSTVGHPAAGSIMASDNSMASGTSTAANSVADNPGMSETALSPASLASTEKNVLRVSGSVLPKDSTAAEITELQAAIEKLEQSLFAPGLFIVSEIDNPWEQTRKAIEELEQKLTPSHSGF